jgi:pimeloyl-ACP methyl ester carboxylesterase
MIRLLVGLAAATSWFFCNPAFSQPHPERPVVVIPGILGSKICEKSTGNVVWGDKWSLGNFSKLALPVSFDEGNLPLRACGLINSVNILGPWQIHQYDDLFSTLGGMGYKEENKNLFVFDYDWRLSNRTSARRLQEFLQKNLPTGKFDLVVHSMGGIVAKVWMAELGGASRVSTFLTFGTPQLGSATTFKTLDDGWGFWGNLAAHGLGSVRETSMTFPSVYELLPSYQKCCAFKSNTSPLPNYFDPFQSASWEKFSWLPAEFSNPDRKAWLKRTLQGARVILGLAVPPGPKVVMVVNSLIPTTWRVFFDAASGKVLNYMDQPGDGTVAQWSASNNQLNEGRPSLTSHQTIFADDAARQVLKWVLADGAQPTSGFTLEVKASLETNNSKFVNLRSAAAQIDPPVLEPGQAGNFVVRLGGYQDLAESDLSNIEARLDGSSNKLILTGREIEPDLDGKTLLVLTYAFQAPEDIGSFAATVKLPAVANISDTGLVIPK